MKKKMLAFLLGFILIIVPMISIAADYSAMSVEDLLSEMNQIRAELQSRDLSEEMLICDNDGMKITINGKPEIEQSYDGSYTLTINYIAVNTGDKALSYCFDKICINGWEVSCLDIPSLDAGKKTKGTIEVYCIDEKAEIKSVDEIEDIEFYGYTFDSVTYNSLTDNIRMKVVFK